MLLMLCQPQSILHFSIKNRTKIGYKPRGPPPVYQPDVVVSNKNLIFKNSKNFFIFF